MIKQIGICLALMCGMMDCCAQVLEIYKTDGSVLRIPVAEVDSMTVAVDSHEWVDLGLPSGTLWATCNIGADSPGQQGDYFAWGEAAVKDEPYKWKTYAYYGDENQMLTKYNPDSAYGPVDGQKELLPEDDAASACWGPLWRTPTRADYDELHRECIWTWAQVDGVYGCEVKSKVNDNVIFLPATGYLGGSRLYSTSHCYYWTRTLSAEPISACCMDTYDVSGYLCWNIVTCYRYIGLTVRPVRSSE